MLLSREVVWEFLDPPRAITSSPKASFLHLTVTYSVEQSYLVQVTKIADEHTLPLSVYHQPNS